jgi:UDP-N-acetylglucosamine--N-acetylmuramyl-(pentapeptide) pyrophosphoryl-undecaprenol N-acetylglucosamine transferase
VRVVFSGGGTGGHVYPALSVATALAGRVPAGELAMLYVGRAGSPEERLAAQHGMPFCTIHAAPLRGKSPLQTVHGFVSLGRGLWEARAILGEFRPDAVFATGGYASMPVSIAARWAGIPLLVFLPDVYPGWAVRIAGRLATVVATTTETPLSVLPRGKTLVTGYPLRPEFAMASRQAARDRLGLGSGPVLLVSGASSGSRALNEAVLSGLPELLDSAEILHLTGRDEAPRVLAHRNALEESARGRYHVAGYLDEMADAMAAADLAVMRAGASCLGEPPAAGLPAILVPGPFSDQRRNAEFVVHHDAAVLLDQSAVEERLTPTVRELLTSPDKLQRMAAAARRLARPSAAADLADCLCRLSSRPLTPEHCLR